MKKFLLLILLFAGWSSILCAEKISQYDVDVSIQQSGELQITETIHYDFEGASKHGIYRDIPFTVKGSVLPKDIGIYNFSVQMDGKSVEWQQNVLNSFNAGEMIRIKVGSESTTITGEHIYTITYQVKKGVLPSSLDSSQDAIRWNSIGTGWEVPIEKTQSDFHLPHSLDQSNVSVGTFKGQYGSKNSDGEISWINNHHFQLKTNHLAPHEGVTVEVSYPINLLEQSGDKNMALTTSEKVLGDWHWPVMIAFLLYLFGFLKKYSGVIDERSIAPQYNPPKGLNILQAGLIYDKFADNEDFSAAVLELGQKGYLEIFQKDKDDEPLLKKTDKSTKNLSSDLKYLMDHILFSQKRSHRLKRYSKTGSATLQDGFEEINKMLYSWSVESGYIREDPQAIRKKFLSNSIWVLIPIIALSLYSIFRIYGIETVIILLFSSLFISAGLFITLSNKNTFSKIFGSIFIVAGSVQLVGILGFNSSWFLLLFSPITAIVILSIVIYIIYHKVGVYTQKGADAHKHMLGLKEFMNRVKEDEIRRRLEDDPLYLEKYLPYAVLFGITEHWLSLFEILDVRYPHWYHGSISHISNFSSDMNSAATPPSNSGGSSGGGGFSGGGSGGGGGGSW